MRRPGFVLAVALFAACAVPTRVDTLGPDFQGAETVRLRGNLLPTPAAGIGAIELNAERIERPEQPFKYALLVEVRAQGLRIRDGESLRLAIGTDTIGLRRDSSITAWPRLDPTVQEQARYPAPDSVMMRLASAAEVAIAVRGGVRWERRRLSEENLAVLRRWAQAYVRPDSIAPPLEGGGEGEGDGDSEREREQEVSR